MTANDQNTGTFSDGVVRIWNKWIISKKSNSKAMLSCYSSADLTANISLPPTTLFHLYSYASCSNLLNPAWGRKISKELLSFCLFVLCESGYCGVRWDKRSRRLWSELYKDSFLLTVTCILVLTCASDYVCILNEEPW